MIADPELIRIFNGIARRLDDRQLALREEAKQKEHANVMSALLLNAEALALQDVAIAIKEEMLGETSK